MIPLQHIPAQTHNAPSIASATRPHLPSWRGWRRARSSHTSGWTRRWWIPTHKISLKPFQRDSVARCICWAIKDGKATFSATLSAKFWPMTARPTSPISLIAVVISALSHELPLRVLPVRWNLPCQILPRAKQSEFWILIKLAKPSLLISAHNLGLQISCIEYVRPFLVLHEHSQKSNYSYYTTSFQHGSRELLGPLFFMLRDYRHCQKHIAHSSRFAVLVPTTAVSVPEWSESSLEDVHMSCWRLKCTLHFSVVPRFCPDRFKWSEDGGFWMSQHA